MNICPGLTTGLSNAVAGGVWSSSNVNATIGSATGIVTGVTSGTTIITYTLPTGCINTTVVTVNPLPGPITGVLSFCQGTSTTLSDAVAGGAWSSSASSIATISGAGVVTGVSPGTTTIFYTLPTGCYANVTITVNTQPGIINGSAGLCNGSTTSLSDATGGGIWSSSSPAIGTISGTGLVTGISPGTTTISYTLPTGCGTIKTVTVNAAPTTILGNTNICSGASTTLSDITSGGIWSSSNPAVGTIDAFGNVTGVSSGTATISYTLAGSCYIVTMVTVNVSPGPINGSTNLCSGTATTLSNAVAGGTWSSSNAGVATIGLSTGIVTSMGTGTATITYTLGSGCISSVAVTVNPTPTSIIGAGGVCAGTTNTLSDAITGGIWSSSNPTIATISPSGVFSGISAGTTTISYTLPGGCFASVTEIVNPTPPNIIGANTLCIGTTINLTDTGAGGTWSSVNPSIASINSFGNASGISAGTDTIIYSYATGCHATLIITVNILTSPITGTASTCISITTTLSDAIIGGVWSSANMAIATASPATGVVTGISAGTTTITYYLSSGCNATITITVNPLPAPITGGTFACIGGTLTLDDTSAGGIWNSSNAGIATISSIGGSSGVITGIGAGTVVMTYSFGTGCYTTIVVTVNTAPTISATATLSACGGLYLATATGGATYSWSPSAGVSCNTCGTTYIDPASATYVVTGTLGGCSNTALVTVNNNRIYGHITLGAAIPASKNMKVWLIQYNPADSSLITTDSILTCVDNTIPYYEFDGKPEGNYFVKAELLSSVPGVTGYVPTYGLQNAHWDSATTIPHTSASDSLHIDMIYGIVPSGSGSISGYIVSGAGRATSSEVPVAGMLVYLLDNTYNVLTYTYTDGSGAYSFGSLAHGTSYIVYPEDYDYYTTPSAIITLTFSSDIVTHIDFKQHTTLGTITPFVLTGVTPLTLNHSFNIYPNPASGSLNLKWTNQAPCNADVVITDMLGREVYKTVININATKEQALLDINGLEKGIYMISVRSTSINFSGKLLIGE